MRKKTRPRTICVVCKRPITRQQRPSILLRRGKEIHVECWEKYKEMARNQPN